MRVAGHGLLEREDDLLALGSLAREGLQGHGTFALIEGPPGAGKSSLLEALAGQASDPVRVLRARGAELERDFPFGIARQLFEPALGSLSPGAREQVLAGAAELAAPIVDLSAPAAPGGPDPMPLLHGLYWLATNLAHESPLLIVVDDLHWADEQSLQWLGYLARRLESLPIALVCAARPSEGGGAVDALRDQAQSIVVPAPLSQAATTVVLARAFGREPHPDFARAVHEATRGNPFYLGELARELADQKTDPDAAAAARVPDTAPVSVARAVVVRIARMGPEAGALARALAVLGGEARLPIAAALAGLGEEESIRAAERLATGDVVLAGTPVRFVHPVVRTALYEDISAARRAASHGHAARILEAADADSDEVSSHLLLSEVSGEPWAADALQRSAVRALAKAAPGVAARHLERALAEPLETSKRIDVLRRLATCELFLGGRDAVNHLDSALDLTDDPALRARIRYEAAPALLAAQRMDTATEYLDIALTEVPDTERELRLQLRALLCAALLTGAGERRRLHDLMSDVEPLPCSTPAERTLMACLAAYRSLLGEAADEAADLATAAIGGGKLLEEEPPNSPIVAWAIGTLLNDGRLDEAETWARKQQALARRRGSPLGAAIASASLVPIYRRRGDITALRAETASAIESAEQIGWRSGVPIFAAYAVHTLIERGEHETADRLLARLDLDGELPLGSPGTQVLFWRAQLRGEQGRVEEGLQDLFELRDRDRRDGLVGIGSLHWAEQGALLLARAGRSEEAAAAVEELTEVAKRRRTDHRQTAIALRLSALLGDRDAMLDRLLEAEELFGRAHAHLERARVQVDIGALLRSERKATEARPWLQKGMDGAHRCGATALVERALEELRVVGARPRRPASSGRDALTPAEIRVAEMAATGLSNPEIAQALFLTRKTVEMHLSRVYRKLDIRSRTEVAAALAAGRRAARP